MSNAPQAFDASWVSVRQAIVTLDSPVLVGTNSGGAEFRLRRTEVISMLRNLAIFGATVVASVVAGMTAHAAPATEPAAVAASQVAGTTDHVAQAIKLRHHERQRHLVDVASAETASGTAGPHLTASHVRRVHPVQPAAIQPLPVATPEVKTEAPPTLTHQEEQVSETAGQNGDQEFLMVDKALGKIILFENDKPVFSGSALTGESTADQLPPGALHQKFAKLTALDTKVTPAGRYTVTRGHDSDYGPLLDINEIKGKDWGIAIHQVYLGTPSERRAERLRSPNDQDKHITFGCINVTPEAIRFLMKELPKKRATPLYILPLDETSTATYFSPHSS
jgi:hypothetical protein